MKPPYTRITTMAFKKGNKISVGNSGGRPPKFKTVKDLDIKIAEYFKATKPTEITVTGLALYLDIAFETLMAYERKDEFSESIKRARLRVHNEYEKDLRKKGRSGDIFALKNFGWKDKQEPIQFVFSKDSLEEGFE